MTLASLETSPDARPHRHRVRTWILAIVVAASATWARWPLPAAHVTRPVIPAPPKALDKVAEPLDVLAFNAPLWIADQPPPKPMAAQPPTAPPVVRLQLLAIVKEPAGRSAVVYDPSADTVTTVSKGQSIAGFKVDSVGAETVKLVGADGQPRTLSLERLAASRERGRNE